MRKVIALKYPNRMSGFDIVLNTGMRRGEQYSRIRWNCVGLGRKDLFIPGSKTGKSRHIPLNAAAIDAFKELRLGTGGKDPIFAGRNHGEGLQGPRYWFDAAVRETGLPDFTWHDQRHTSASRLVMSGTDLRTVAERMGHATTQMTKRYSHLMSAYKQAAVDRLGSFAVAAQTNSTDTKTGTGRKHRSGKNSEKQTK